MAEDGLTSSIEVFAKGLEDQQPELVRVLETTPIVRRGASVTVMRMADIVDVTHRPEVRSTPAGSESFLGAPEALIPLQIDNAGESWAGSGRAVTDPAKATVRVAFTIRGAPYWIDVPFEAKK